MNQVSLYREMARYNLQMNKNLMDFCKKLPRETLHEDKKAFFKSIFGTFNHIMVGDLIWLSRFRNIRTFHSLSQINNYPSPTTLNQNLFNELKEFMKKRTILDETILQFTEELTQGDLDKELHFTSTKGIEYKNSFMLYLQHFFNHQTHHRGQISVLLNQQNIDVGSTDLPYVIQTSDNSAKSA